MTTKKRIANLESLVDSLSCKVEKLISNSMYDFEGEPKRGMLLKKVANLATDYYKSLETLTKLSDKVSKIEEKILNPLVKSCSHTHLIRVIRHNYGSTDYECKGIFYESHREETLNDGKIIVLKCHICGVIRRLFVGEDFKEA